MKRVKIVVDRDLCETNGACALAAPTVFEIGADNELHVRILQPTAAEMGAVETAVRRCPKGALSLEEI